MSISQSTLRGSARRVRRSFGASSDLIKGTKHLSSEPLDQVASAPGTGSNQLRGLIKDLIDATSRDRCRIAFMISCSVTQPSATTQGFGPTPPGFAPPSPSSRAGTASPRHARASPGRARPSAFFRRPRRRRIAAVVMIVEPPTPFIYGRLPLFPVRRRLRQMPADATVDQGDRAPKRRSEPSLRGR
jgi:hypothetical protein